MTAREWDSNSPSNVFHEKLDWFAAIETLD